jgi:hypothetical protein
MKMIAKDSFSGTFVTLSAALLAAAALTACGSEKPAPGKDTPPATTTTAAAKPGGGAAGMTNTPAVTNAPAAPAATTAAPAATPGPNGRSVVPTQDEWTGAKEVGVKGSSKLNCETKMVREWLRVSCRGKNDTGGEPVSVTMKKGGGKGDTFTFAANKVASLVMPYVDGIDIAAEFAWTDKKMELVVTWPHGAPMPPLKGEFR